jgi:hypothetical protein
MSDNTEALTEFDYLLNRFEFASQSASPAANNYATHRRALYAYVRRLEALAQQAATPAPAEPVAHIYPSDLERFKTSETFATVYSVPVGSPDERSVPLYAAAPATPAAQAGDALPEDLGNLLREARDNAYASLAETDISQQRREYRRELVQRLDTMRAALAARGQAGDERTQAAEDVLAERRRQVEAEGWTPQHDDSHSAGDMARAAACYAYPRRCRDPRIKTPADWPWPGVWWKPNDRRRNLVKAGALILAEIERLDRAALRNNRMESVHDCRRDTRDAGGESA